MATGESTFTATLLEEIIFALSFATVSAMTLNSLMWLIMAAMSQPVL
jgi:hypothetical protein